MTRLRPHPIRALTEWVEHDSGMIWGLAIAFAIRLALIPWFSDPVNFYGYHLTASFVQQGGNPWRIIASDPALAELNPWGYPPLFLAPAVLASILSFGNGYVFGLWLKVALIAADLATGILLFRTARCLGLAPSKARGVSLGYLFNPFTVLVCVIWGTNDPLVVAFTMAAIYYAMRKPPSLLLSSLFLGIGIAFKVYPVIFLPLFLASLRAWRPRLQFLAIAVGTPLFTAAPVLLTSPLDLATTLGIFSTGVGPDRFNPALSSWSFLKDLGVVLGPGAVLIASLLFLLALLALAWWIVSRRMTFVRAATIAILGLFIIAPRLNQNYFLWAIPLLALAGSVESWRPWGRRLATWAWIPLVVSALSNNGTGEVVGLAYWMLVSLGRTGAPVLGLPPWTLTAFLGVWVAILALAVTSLLVGLEKSPATRLASPGRTPRTPRNPTKRTIALTVATAVVLFAIGSVAVDIAHHPVWPEDFGSYRVTPTEVVLVNEFRALLLSFEWHLGGTGFADQSTRATHPLVLDTRGADGTSWIERSLPDRPVRISLSLAVLAVHQVPGVLILAEFPGGLLQADGDPNQILNLSYVDSVRNQTTVLGPIEMGTVFNVTVVLSYGQTEVDGAGTRAIASGFAPIDNLRIGHTRPSADGGGQVAVERVQISWPSPDGSYAPFVGPATIAIGVGVLLVPIEVRRRRPGKAP